MHFTAKSAFQYYLRDDGTFASVFQAATALHGDEIGMPRLTTRQRNRNNVPASSAQEYYRRAVFLPFIDCCVAQMKVRFNKQALSYSLSADRTSAVTLHQQ